MCNNNHSYTIIISQQYYTHKSSVRVHPWLRWSSHTMWPSLQRFATLHHSPVEVEQSRPWNCIGMVILRMCYTNIEEYVILTYSQQDIDMAVGPWPPLQFTSMTKPGWLWPTACDWRFFYHDIRDSIVADMSDIICGTCWSTTQEILDDMEPCHTTITLVWALNFPKLLSILLGGESLHQKFCPRFLRPELNTRSFNKSTVGRWPWPKRWRAPKSVSPEWWNVSQRPHLRQGRR